MPRKKKKARELTDAETLRKLFPKRVRDAAKKTALDSRPKDR
ncbi:MAG TPA: hypothetical protein VGB06_04750 [Solirubrobacterales bacterium]|jgi:hypothetical protein